MNNYILSSVIENDAMGTILKDFTRLKDRCYVDNTGAALYPESLIKEVSVDFMNNIYMNPHSDIYSHNCVEEVRAMVLQHFNTTSDEYSIIFTSGATQALKLLAESFQFNNESKCGAFVHLRDNHTSVLGLREIVKENDVDIFHIHHEDFLKTLSSDEEDEKFNLLSNIRRDNANALFVYPAQNNFNGFKYPINTMDRIKNECFDKYVNKSNPEDSYNWYVLLDAAAFASTSRLDLNIVKPDFLCLSFYKIFGYPTGLGALIVRNNCKHLLNRKKYYGGGTVDTVLNTDPFFARKQEFSNRFEDGTVSFLSILALRHSFKVLKILIPNTITNHIMDTIKYHTFYLGKELYTRLKGLKHKNGRRAIIFYMDSDFSDVDKQGGVVTFNIVREDGSFVGYNEFEKKALIYKIYVRSGCFCNSGSCQRHFKLSNKDIKDRYEAGHICGGGTDLIHGVPTGAIRVSFGYYNTFLNIDQLIAMITDSYINVHAKYSYREPRPFKDETLKYFKEINLEDEINKLNPKSKLKEIMIYPIDQCGPYRIKSHWSLCDEGLIYNKNWKIKNKIDTTLNQYQIRLMSRIYPEIDLKQKCLILHNKGMKSITVPLNSDIPNKVDEDKTFEHDCGDEVANWISEAVKCPNLRLVKLPKETRNIETIQYNELHLSSYGKNIIILLNTPAKNKSNGLIKHSKSLNNEVSNNNSLLNNIKGNLIVEMPQALFYKDYDKVIIDNHEFEVEGRYPQEDTDIDKHKKDPSNPKANVSEDQVQAILLSYVKTVNEVTKTLKVNSQVNLISTREINTSRDAKRKKHTAYNIESKNKFTNILGYVLRRRKKYEINELSN